MYFALFHPFLRNFLRFKSFLVDIFILLRFSYFKKIFGQYYWTKKCVLEIFWILVNDVFLNSCEWCLFEFLWMMSFWILVNDVFLNSCEWCLFEFLWMMSFWILVNDVFLNSCEWCLFEFLWMMSFWILVNDVFLNSCEWCSFHKRTAALIRTSFQCLFCLKYRANNISLKIFMLLLEYFKIAYLF